ncbi:MAG TPA: efflux transporter outer membrane subunit [Caulobacteraceae bacterium]|nr:efflux transporter outer membrane subunit [Caulobacteraceae bacterium]
MRRAAALALAGALAACTLEPAYHRPPAPVPPTVANSFGVADQTARPPSWRAFFDDPRLVKVIERGLANNRDLPAAVANVEIARAQWLSQRAQLFPMLNGQAGANLSQIPAAVALGSGAKGSIATNVYTAELAIPSYEVDLFGRVRSLTKSAREQYFANQAARDAAQIGLVGQLAQAWLTIGSDRSLLAVSNDTLGETSRSLELTRAKLQHGEAAQSDVDRAEGLVAQARFDVARYSTLVAQDKDALDLVAGTPIPNELLPDGVDDEVGIMGELPTGVASSALLSRPDVLQAEDQLKAANANIGAARAAFFPNISLTAAGGVTSTALSGLFRAGAGTWSFAPQLVQPIFDAGKNRAGLLQAKAQRDLAQANYEKAVQTAFREVADALAQRDRIDAEVSAAEEQVGADLDAVRLIQAEYARGSASELDVLTAEASLYAAEETLTTTRLLKASNLVSLYQALGGGLS